MNKKEYLAAVEKVVVDAKIHFDKKWNRDIEHAFRDGVSFGASIIAKDVMEHAIALDHVSVVVFELTSKSNLGVMSMKEAKRKYK